ncbi:methyltransferase domain-containing protein [Actinacidiphila acididurans]|uniref:Methyltransferase domain-containing protein n=1 Tax=Actinacidiphila acididurans TaxID=2784346 RepID=A0ABS2TXY9_9ACTN|nr:methyltransferase domain-containing protein [Actinacidiphila acididurans]MBM9508206.1 methyltransferase domain-containing protein [Actinacidiphila acididurans]
MNAIAQLKPADIWRDADAAKNFLDQAAAELAAAKQQLDSLLRAEPGAHVLDVGCGTGDDVRALAARVGPAGRVVGLDSSEQLIARGRPAGPDAAPVEFVLGQADALPFDDATFDVVRSERVIQHVPDPAAAVAEMLRVVKPGGQVLVTDPDHGMWAPDLDDRELTRRIMTWWSDHVPNPWVARRLRDFFVRAGARDVAITLQPVVLTSLAAADALTLMSRAATAAEAQGVVPAGQARAWGAEIERRDQEGRFLMFGTFVVVTGVK